LLRFEHEEVESVMRIISTKPRKIAGLTTFCHKKYLDEFLSEQKTSIIQPFELYEGAPEFLPLNSPVFIFQAGEHHRLRAIARFVGYLDVDGWKKSGEVVADELLNIYRTNSIVSHDTRKDLTSFCSNKGGIRGLFTFDRIIEIESDSNAKCITKGDVAGLFKGKQPYAQGFPYRYLNTEMTKDLITLILERTKNSMEIAQFLKEFCEIAIPIKTRRKRKHQISSNYE